MTTVLVSSAGRRVELLRGFRQALTTSASTVGSSPPTSRGTPAPATAPTPASRCRRARIPPSSRAWSSCAPSNGSTSSYRRSIPSCRCWRPPAPSWPRSERRWRCRPPPSSRSRPTRWRPTNGWSAHDFPTVRQATVGRRPRRSGVMALPARGQATVRERGTRRGHRRRHRRSSRWRRGSVRSSSRRSRPAPSTRSTSSSTGRVRASAPCPGAASRCVPARWPRRSRSARRHSSGWPPMCARRCPGRSARSTIQVFVDDASGQLAIIELNARFGGGFPLSREAGADFPRWILEDLLGLPSTATADGWRDGVVMLRYDAAVFVPRDGPGHDVDRAPTRPSRGHPIDVRRPSSRTVDSSLWYLLRPQLLAVLAEGGEVVGISAPGPWVEALERDGVRHIALPSSTRGWDVRRRRARRDRPVADPAVGALRRRPHPQPQARCLRPRRRTARRGAGGGQHEPRSVHRRRQARPTRRRARPRGRRRPLLRRRAGPEPRGSGAARALAAELAAAHLPARQRRRSRPLPAADRRRRAGTGAGRSSGQRPTRWSSAPSGDWWPRRGSSS